MVQQFCFISWRLWWRNVVLGIMDVWLKDQPYKIYVGQWPIFHGPLILLYIIVIDLNYFYTFRNGAGRGFVSLQALALVASIFWGVQTKYSVFGFLRYEQVSLSTSTLYENELLQLPCQLSDNLKHNEGKFRWLFRMCLTKCIQMKTWSSEVWSVIIA